MNLSKIKKGNRAHRVVIAFNDQIFNFFHLNRPFNYDVELYIDRSQKNPSYDANIYYSCTINIRDLMLCADKE